MSPDRPMRQTFCFLSSGLGFQLVCFLYSQLSLKEELKRLLHRFLGMEAYRREFHRILPNIKVKECVDYKKSRYTLGMKKYIDSQNRR